MRPGFEKWLAACYIKRSDYHVGKFEGNDCRTLLKILPQLQVICPEIYNKYIDAFAKFNDVVEACYGFNLAPDFEE